MILWQLSWLKSGSSEEDYKARLTLGEGRTMDRMNVGSLYRYRQGLGDTDVKQVLHQLFLLRGFRNNESLLTGSAGQALALSYGALHLAVCPSVRPQSMSNVAKWLHLPARHLQDNTGLCDIHTNPMTKLLHVHSRFLRH